MSEELQKEVDSYSRGFADGAEPQRYAAFDSDENPTYCLGFGAGREAYQAALRAWLRGRGYETRPA